MDTKEYTTIDRAALGWPSGPWDGEPDKVQWPDEKTGLPCLAVRHPTSGHWCGYVGVSDRHPWHGKHYDHVAVECHWGLTYADACSPSESEGTGICHLPAAGEPDHVWWFGFDCAHCDDHGPADAQRARDRKESCFRLLSDSHYRTLVYVKAECASMATQLLAAQGD